MDEQELLSQLCLQESDGVQRRYTLAQLTDLLQVPRQRVRAWMQAGLIEPVETVQGTHYFDFRQVAGAKTLCELSRAGMSIAKIRRSLEKLKSWLPDAQAPLEQLALLEKNGQLLVRLEAGLVEPSGQMCLDFGEEFAPLAVPPDSAAEWFATGCRHEEDGFLPEALHAYRQALLLGGPDADTAFNVANVLYALGQRAEAGERYRQAVEIEPRHAEAWNNLGIVLAELQRCDEARDALLQAIALQYADASYNLADMLDGLGRPDEAKEYWQAYLRSAPPGPWRRHARRKLGS